MVQITWLTRRRSKSRDEENGFCRGVREGDRFFECGRWENIWVVERIVQPRGAGLPHVVISHARLRSERRLVALATLLDTKRFSLDGQHPTDQDVGHSHQSAAKTAVDVLPFNKSTAKALPISRSVNQGRLD